MSTSTAPSGAEDNVHSAPSTPTRRWGVNALGEAPGPDASAAEVARYLYDEIEGSRLFEPMSQGWGKWYCQTKGHDWNSVSRELRRLHARGIARRDPAPAVVTTDDGFRVNDTVLHGLRDERWIPRCPRTLTGFNALDGFEHRTSVGNCESWWCPQCGPKHLVVLHGLVTERVQSLSIVYTSVATYDAKLSGRIRQRAKTAQADFFWYRHLNYRSDADEVAYVATHDLGATARTEPKDFVARSPHEALDWLRRDVMIFPDYIRHDWSEHWEPAKEPDEQRERTGDWLWFRGLDDAQASVARTALGRLVQEKLGIDLNDPQAGSALSKGKRKLVKVWLGRIVTEVRGARSQSVA